MNTHAADPTFKEQFCQAFRCRPEEFHRKLLMRTLYPHALPLAGFIFSKDAKAVAQTWDFLEDAGQACSESELRRVVNEYHYRLRLRGGFCANRLRLRVSGRRLLSLYSRLNRATTRVTSLSAAVSAP